MNHNERLKRLRINLALSVNEMASALGLTGDNSGDTVRAYERNSRPMTGPIIKLIAYIEKYGIIEKD